LEAQNEPFKIVYKLYCRHSRDYSILRLTFTSWALYPTLFTPFGNWLSDLGNSVGNPSGAIFYNIGCILTGTAYIIFLSGFYKWYTSEKTRKIGLMIAQAIGFLAAFSLIMVGVFSENAGDIHTLWSLVFFLLNLITILLFSLALYKHPSYIKAISYYGFAVVIFNLLFVSAIVATINLHLSLVYNSPIFKWFTVFTALGGSACLRITCSKNSSHKLPYMQTHTCYVESYRINDSLSALRNVWLLRFRAAQSVST
jgi:hypothetical protein